MTRNAAPFSRCESWKPGSPLRSLANTITAFTQHCCGRQSPAGVICKARLISTCHPTAWRSGRAFCRRDEGDCSRMEFTWRKSAIGPTRLRAMSGVALK